MYQAKVYKKGEILTFSITFDMIAPLVKHYI